MSFTEVLMHPTKELKPLTSETRPSAKELKEPAKEPKPLAKSLELKGSSEILEKPAPNEKLLLTGRSDSDITSGDGEDVDKEDRAHFGVSLDSRSFRNTLTCIKRGVVRCLKWLDSGLSRCACGLMGPAPRPLIEGPREPIPSLTEGPNVNA